MGRTDTRILEGGQTNGLFQGELSRHGDDQVNDEPRPTPCRGSDRGGRVRGSVGDSPDHCSSTAGYEGAHRRSGRVKSQSLCTRLDRFGFLRTLLVGDGLIDRRRQSRLDRSHPREVIISREPLTASALSTLAKAEARFKAGSPKGAKIAFTALPKLGPIAFSWSYVDNGGLLVGVEYNKGNMAWGAVVGASVNLMGAPASHVAAVEQLIKLDMAA